MGKQKGELTSEQMRRARDAVRRGAADDVTMGEHVVPPVETTRPGDQVPPVAAVKPKCQRCGSGQFIKNNGLHDGVQYWACGRPTCLWSWKVGARSEKS